MQLMIILDGTVVTVALPTIQGDLGFSQAGLAWVMNSYLIAFAGLLLLAGRIGDLIGSKRVFLAGLGLFTAASLLCGVATSAEVLIAGRFLQGVGGALASAVILGMIVGLYPAPGEQARAMGVYGFTSASGASIGLILGGVITQTVGWHWAFLINVPIGVVSLALAVRLLAGQRGLGLGKGADVLGAVLVTAGLSLGVYTIVQTAEPHATLPRTLILAAVCRAPAGSLRTASGAHREAAALPAHLPQASGDCGQPRGRSALRGRLRLPVHDCALPAAGAGLRLAHHRPGLPPGTAHGSGDVPVRRAAADRPLRRPHDAAWLDWPRSWWHCSGSARHRSMARTSSTSRQYSR